MEGNGRLVAAGGANACTESGASGAGGGGLVGIRWHYKVKSLFELSTLLLHDKKPRRALKNRRLSRTADHRRRRVLLSQTVNWYKNYTNYTSSSYFFNNIHNSIMHVAGGILTNHSLQYNYSFLPTPSKNGKHHDESFKSDPTPPSPDNERNIQVNIAGGNMRQQCIDSPPPHFEQIRAMSKGDKGQSSHIGMCEPGLSGLWCDACPAGKWSDGGSECRHCDKPFNVEAYRYTHSGWSNSTCPFRCPAGYPDVHTNPTCLDPWRYTMAFFGGLMGLLIIGSVLALLILTSITFNTLRNRRKKEKSYYSELLLSGHGMSDWYEIRKVVARFIDSTIMVVKPFKSQPGVMAQFAMSPSSDYNINTGGIKHKDREERRVRNILYTYIYLHL